MQPFNRKVFQSTSGMSTVRGFECSECTSLMVGFSTKLNGWRHDEEKTMKQTIVARSNVQELVSRSSSLVVLSMASTELMNVLMQTVAKRLAWPGSEAQSTLPPGPAHDIALQLASDPLRCLENLKMQYGPIVGFRLLSRPVVLISSPAQAREVFVTKSSTFVKEGTAFFPNSSLAGNGLLVSDGDVWKRQRRLSNPAFRKAAVDTYAKAMVSRTMELVERKWNHGGIFDVYGDFNDLTTKIVASSLFGGSTIGAEDIAKVGPAITRAFEYFSRRGTSMFIVPEWVPTPDNLQYLSSVETLDRIVYNLIAERRAKLASRCEQHVSTVDLLTRLLQARDEDGSGMDDRSIRDELMTLLVAGQETSAIMLTWSLVMLARNPRAQLTLHKECNEVLGDKLPTYADVPKLGYLEAFMWETMRLMPPAYIVGRCASEDTLLGQFELQAGTTVLVSPYLLHQDPQYWSRANRFEPERWLPGGDAEAHMENDSYWPFGGGPRNCIGMGYALMEVALVLAIIVTRFKVRLPAGAPVPRPQAMITLRPENEVKLQLVRRR